MNNIICAIPTYKINGINAKTGGEWPGILPCHFKSSKCIIRPPNSEIFSNKNELNQYINRPLKRTIIPPKAKEFIFRSSSNPVAPFKALDRNQSVKIFPSSYLLNLNINEVKKADLQPINDIKLFPQEKLSSAELANQWTREFRLIRDGAKMVETFKKMTNHQIMKHQKPIHSSTFANSQLVTSRYNDTGHDSTASKGIKAYSSRHTDVFDKKLPLVIQ